MCYWIGFVTLYIGRVRTTLDCWYNVNSLRMDNLEFKQHYVGMAVAWVIMYSQWHTGKLQTQLYRIDCQGLTESFIYEVLYAERCVKESTEVFSHNNKTQGWTRV